MKHKPRRIKYPAEPTAFMRVIIGNREQDPDHAKNVIYAVRKSFELMKSGTTDRAHFDRVANALNAALVRSELIDELCVETIRMGMSAIENSKQLYLKHGKFGFYGADLGLAFDAIDLYAQIFEKSTPRQMDDAESEAYRRVLEIRARSGTV